MFFSDSKYMYRVLALLIVQQTESSNTLISENMYEVDLICNS